MKTLPTEITAKGFTFRQIAREGDVALYSQSPIGGGVIAYEIIIIQSHNGREAFGKYYPPAEYYPSDEQWGRMGWTISGYGDDTLRHAQLKMAEVLAARSRPEAK